MLSEHRKERKAIKNSWGRLCFVAIALVLQLGWLVSAINQAWAYYPYAALLMEILA